MHSPDRDFALEKVGRDKWIADLDSALPIDSTKVQERIDALRDLKTGKFVNYHAEDLGQFGLDRPAITVTLTDRRGQDYPLHVAPTGPENDPEQARYATIPGSHKVFLLPLERLGLLNMSLADFEETE